MVAVLADTAHGVLDRRAGRQDDDRQIGAGGTEASEQREALHVGEPDVEHHDVEVAPGSEGESLASRCCDWWYQLGAGNGG